MSRARRTKKVYKWWKKYRKSCMHNKQPTVKSVKITNCAESNAFFNQIFSTVGSCDFCFIFADAEQKVRMVWEWVLRWLRYVNMFCHGRKTEFAINDRSMVLCGAFRRIVFIFTHRNFPQKNKSVIGEKISSKKAGEQNASWNKQ